MDKIIEYIKEREKDLGYWAGGLDDGTYSSAMETYQEVIKMLEKKDAEDNTMDNDIVEIITHTYYADGKVIRSTNDYIYKNVVEAQVNLSEENLKEVTDYINKNR